MILGSDSDKNPGPCPHKTTYPATRRCRKANWMWTQLFPEIQRETLERSSPVAMGEQVGEMASGAHHTRHQAQVWLPMEQAGPTSNPTRIISAHTLYFLGTSSHSDLFPLDLYCSLEPREKSIIPGDRHTGIRRAPDSFCGP